MTNDHPPFLGVLVIIVMKILDQYFAGAVENYHRVRLKYLPKLHSYKPKTTLIKSMIAVIEVNRNIPTGTEVRHRWEYSKAQAKWLWKKRNAPKVYTYREEIRDEILENMMNNKIILVDWSEYLGQQPKNIYPAPRPTENPPS